MKFFTKKWHSGDLADEEFDAVPVKYAEYVASLRLPPSIARLAAFDAHDAYILDVQLEPVRYELTIRLRCGHLQKGYSDAVLVFLQTTVSVESLHTLQRRQRPAKCEVLYTEVDRAGKDFEYRLLLWPYEEVVIAFQGAELTQHFVSSRDAE